MRARAVDAAGEHVGVALRAEGLEQDLGAHRAVVIGARLAAAVARGRAKVERRGAERRALPGEPHPRLALRREWRRWRLARRGAGGGELALAQRRERLVDDGRARAAELGHDRLEQGRVLDEAALATERARELGELVAREEDAAELERLREIALAHDAARRDAARLVRAAQRDAEVRHLPARALVELLAHGGHAHILERAPASRPARRRSFSHRETVACQHALNSETINIRAHHFGALPCTGA